MRGLHGRERERETERKRGERERGGKALYIPRFFSLTPAGF